MENMKKEYTGMKAVKIEFNQNDIIATSGGSKICTEGMVDLGGTLQCGFMPTLHSWAD